MNTIKLENKIFSEPRFLNSPWLSPNYIDWSFLRLHGTAKHFKKGEMLVSSSEPSDVIYYIARGRVRTSVLTETGEEKIILVIDQGNILDTVSAIDNQPNYLLATVVTDSLIYKIDKKTFLNLVDKSKGISMKLIEDLTRKFRILITQVEDLTFMSSSGRIAKCLYRLCHEYGIPHENGIKLNVKFTHQEMAIYAGTCRVTVSNILQNMEKCNIISKENGYIVVNNIDKLKQYIDYVK